jgi:hypothetical protein
MAFMASPYATYSLDVDGLIADFLAGAFDYVAAQGGNRYSAKDVTAWRVSGSLISDADRALFHHFVEAPESYGDLPLMPGALEGIQTLKRTGARVVVASHAPPGALPYRQAWLDRHQIPYDDILVSPNAKVECLERYAPEGPILFLDDDPGTARTLGLPRLGVSLLVVKGDLPRSDLAHDQPMVDAWSEVEFFLQAPALALEEAHL